MIAVLITLGILVGFIMAVIIPWALLRQLERKDEGQKGEKKKEG
jgi:preprotein translocase subunit SecF